jgi:hypothetical protein
MKIATKMRGAIRNGVLWLGMCYKPKNILLPVLGFNVLSP